MSPQSGRKTSIDEERPTNNSEPQLAHDVNCEICGGLGWISADVPVGHPLFGKLVRCPRVKTDKNFSRIQHLRNDLGYLRDKTFSNFDPNGCGGTEEQRSSLRRAYTFLSKAMNETDREPAWVVSPRGWIVLKGGYGCGKTHLAAAIANACLDQGIPATLINVPDLLDYLRAAYNPSVEESFDERFSQIRDSSVLILDDLGSQNTTPWANEKLFQILNSRYVAKLPTVITTNLELDDFDPRIRSRLSDRDLVRFWRILVPDYRRGEPLKDTDSAANALQHYIKKTFDNFDKRVGEVTKEEQKSLNQAYQISRSFAGNPQGWLLITGNSGVGKTHLAAAIANFQSHHTSNVLFVVVPDLLDHLRAAFGPESRTSFDQRFEEVRAASLLVLDDLGTESATPWAREKLYQIINHRYVAMLPTVITTSESPKNFDQRIYTRISDEAICTQINITAPIYRRKER